MSEPRPSRAPTTAQRRLRRAVLELKVLARFLPSERQALFIWAALVGFLGACATVLFKWLTEVVQWALTGQSAGFVATFTKLSPAYRLGIPVAGALCAGLLLNWTANAFRSKRTDYMEAVALGDGVIPVRLTLLRSLSALFSIASGASIGKEGPLVQLAALAASLTAGIRRMSPARRRILVACGAAAGIGAAYHTPLAGALFVAEIVLGSMAMETLAPLLVSSVISALTIRSIEGGEPLYLYANFSPGDIREVVLYAIIGILCGGAATVWMRVLKVSKKAFARLPVAIWLRLTIGGLIIGILAVWYPEVTGNGGSLIRSLLQNEFPWSMVVVLLIFKIFASATAFGSGAVGGVFTPSLMVGSALGFLFACAVAAFWPWSSPDAGGYALIGMGSFLAAATQAPITAILMCFEMTLQYQLVIPLMVAVVAAYATSQRFGAEGLYTESLRCAPKSVFDRPLASVSVADIMRPVSAPIALTTPFRDIAQPFLSAGHRALWVVDDSGCYCGAVLLGTVSQFLSEPAVPGTVIAADIMDEELSPLSPDLSLPLALDCFSRLQDEDLPVVEPNSKKLLGVVSKPDLLMIISELARRESSRLGFGGEG